MQTLNTIFLTSNVYLVAEDVGQKLDAKENKLKLLFIDTAAEVEEDDKQWLKDDRQALVDAGFTVTDFTFTNKKMDEIKKALNDCDVVHIEGGNTFYLLYQMQQTKSLDLIRTEVGRGKVYIGSSAGSIVAGPDIYPAYKLEEGEWVEKVSDTKGLGLIDLVTLPHWGSKHFKDLYLNKRLAHIYNDEYKLILLNDYQYVEMGEDERYQLIDVRK